MAILAGLASAHPGLQQVDFLSFSGRARRLPTGEDWLNPLYPSGYPILLWMGHFTGLNLLWVGKTISVLSASWALWMIGRNLHPMAGIWLLAHAAWLKWGSTEGTDVLAAGLSIAAVLAAEQGRSRTAGTFIGLGCMVRYTALGAIPIVLAMLWMRASPEQRIPQMREWAKRFFIFTLPHWLAALILWRSPLPDQGFNLAIGAGSPTELWSLDTVKRWPQGAYLALKMSLEDWTARVGLLGLGLAFIKRDARAWALLGMGLGHIALIGVAFGNDRLLLPTSMAWSLGVFGFIPPHFQVRARALVFTSISIVSSWLIWNHMSELKAPTPHEQQMEPIVDAVQGLPSPILSSTPWVYQVEQGWLVPSIPVRQAAFDESRGRPMGDHAIHPQQIIEYARTHRIPIIALESGRVGATYPGLRPLLGGDFPKGVVQIADPPGATILQVE